MQLSKNIRQPYSSASAIHTSQTFEPAKNPSLDLLFSLTSTLHSAFFTLHSEVVGLTGLEPVTLRLSSACSNQLSYRPGINRPPRLAAGGAEESRTPDL